MINRGKKNVYVDIFYRVAIFAILAYFTVTLIWGMGKGQIIAAWQMVKGCF